MDQSLAYRGDGEDLIDTEVGGWAFHGQPTRALPIMPLECDMGWLGGKNQALEWIDVHSWNKV